MENILVKFGHRIRELRTDANLSQEELAARSGLDRTFISHVERGSRSITIQSVEKISKGLGLEIKDLFDFSEESNEQIE